MKGEGGVVFKSHSDLIHSEIPKIYGTDSIKNLPHKRKDEKMMKALEARFLEHAPRYDERSDLGGPSGRREVQLLNDWLNYMLKTFVYNVKSQPADKKIRAA